MILPRAIAPSIVELEPIVASWPVTVPFERVVRWLLQFEPEDYDLGIRIIRHLNVLGTEEVRANLKIAYARLQRRARDRKTTIESSNTVFAAMGDAGKSGAMIAYQFRLANSLPESNFSSEERDDYFSTGLVTNIVLIDDIIGTGKTAIDTASSLREETTPLGVKNIFILAVCGFQDAVDKVGEKTGADTFAALTYNADDTVASFDSSFYDGLSSSEQDALLERLKYYNQRCHRSELGYGNVGALIAFQHNPPNVTIPVVWASGNGWSPLFPRLGRIRGIDHFRAKVRAEQKKRATQHSKDSKSLAVEDPATADVTLLVEGKVDEIVLDDLIAREGVAEQLGLASLSTVSVGGVHSSDRLFDLIKQTGGHFILVLDDDRMTNSWVERRAGGVDIPVVKLRPSVVGFLQVPRVFRLLSEKTSAILSQRIDSDPQGTMHELERHLRRIGFGRSPIRTKEVLDTYLSAEAIQLFIVDLKESVSTLFRRA